MDSVKAVFQRFTPRREQFAVIGRSARHPLWWLPDPVANQEESYRRIWQNLRTISEVGDGRHDSGTWLSHDGKFALCCLRIPPESFVPEFATLQDTLARFPFVRLHPQEFLHVPVQEIGFVVDAPVERNELGAGELQEFITASGNALRDFPRFPVTLGPANSFADAAFLDVHDAGWLSRIHRRLIDFAATRPSTRYPYIPHMTIAHYDRTAPAGNLAGVLAEWRDLSLGEFVAKEIDVVLLDTQHAFGPFEVAHTFKLGTTRATGAIPVRPDPAFE